MDRSTRTLLAVTLFVGALFVALNRAVEAAPFGDWLLVLVLAALGVALLLPWEEWATRERERAAEAAARQAARPPAPPVASEGRPAPAMTALVSEGRAVSAIAAEAAPLPFDDDDDYGRIRDTEVRSDVLASAATMDTPEARANEGMVENVMATGATGTVEEVDEIAGGPVASLSKDPSGADVRATGTAQAVKAVETPASLAAPESTASPASAAPEPTVDRTRGDTEARADALASAATTDTPEAKANEGMVENVMETGATGTVEEVDEISGAPSPSIDRDEQPLDTASGKSSKSSRAKKSGPPAKVLAPEASAPDKTADLTETPIEEQLVKSATEAPPEARAVEPPIKDNIVPQPTAEAIAQQAKAEVSPSASDDLTVVEGIGPKMSNALIAAGINTFVALEAASEDAIRAAIQAAGMRFAPSVPTWAEQAGYAARGDWDGLKAFQDTLKGGRR